MKPSHIRWVTLEQKHIDFADKVAARRRAYAIERDRPAYYGAPVENDAALELDILGARTELAAKLFLNPITWHAFEERSVANLPDLEVGNLKIDVKGVPKTSHKLIVKPNCPDRWANLLVIAESHPHYAIVGWVWACDGKQEKYLFNPRKAKQVAHFISQDDPILMPPDVLLEEARRQQQASGLPESPQPELSLPPPAQAREPFVHLCNTCGQWGSFGFGVRLLAGQEGTWYCASHNPDRPLLDGQSTVR